MAAASAWSMSASRSSESSRPTRCAPALGDPGRRQLLRARAGDGWRSADARRGDDAAQRGRHGRQAQRVDEAGGHLARAEVDGQHAAAGAELPLRHGPPGDGLGRPGQTTERTSGCASRWAASVAARLRVAVHAHVQRLDAAQHEERGEGRHDAARVDGHARGPRHRSGARPRPRRSRPSGRSATWSRSPPRCPRPAPAADRGTATRRCCRRRRRRRAACPAATSASQVRDHDRRVGDGLDVEHARGRRGERRLDGDQVGGVHVDDLHPETAEDVGPAVARAAIDGARGDDAVAGADDRQVAAWMAAMPEPKAKPASAPWSSAKAAARASAVGFSMRA